MTLSEQGWDIASISKPLDIISIAYRVQLLFCYCSRMVIETSDKQEFNYGLIFFPESLRRFCQ